MSWANVPEAVFLGLAVGLMLWVLKKHEGQSRLKIWIIAAGASMGLYLVLKMAGIPSDVLGMKILLTLSIMTAANTVLQFLTLLLWEHLARKQMELPIPRLVIDVLTFILMATLAVVLLNTIFDVQLTAFLVTSTVLSAVIGLSLQDILGNVFAGLSLQLERPYEMDDWVAIDGVEGTVEEMNWRVLTVRTRSNDLMAIPNATVSKTVVTNYSQPTKLHRSRVSVGVAYSHPPERVKKVLLGAVSDTSGVSAKPSPSVFLTDFGASSINYDVLFWITDFARKYSICDAVRSRIWYCLQRAEMGIPFPIRDVHLHTVTPDHQAKLRSELRDDILRELKKVDLFGPLGDNDINLLAGRSSIFRYTTGEPIVRQGDTGDSLHIIRNGSVEVTVTSDKSEPAVVAVLGPGKFFGEMSLLTGEARSATVSALEETQVVVVRKEGLKIVLDSNPSLVVPLTDMLEKRRKELEKTKATALKQKKKTGVAAGPGQKEDLLARVRAFFKI